MWRLTRRLEKWKTQPGGHQHYGGSEGIQPDVCHKQASRNEEHLVVSKGVRLAVEHGIRGMLYTGNGAGSGMLVAGMVDCTDLLCSQRYTALFFDDGHCIKKHLT